MNEYRGKRVDNSELIYGYYFSCDGHDYIIHKDVVVKEGFEEGDEMIGGFVEVIPETVGRCTGAKDNKARRIYADDILDAHPDGNTRGKYLRRVTWNEDYMCFQALFSDGSGDLFTKRQCMKYEIVGNVHDDKKLLNPTG